MLSLLGGLWQKAKFDAAHWRRPLHFWSEQKKSRMLQTDFNLLRVTDTSACFVNIAPSKVKHSDAGLELFAAKAAQKSEAN